MSPEFHSIWAGIEFPLLFLAVGIGPALGLLTCIACCVKLRSVPLSVFTLAFTLAVSIFFTYYSCEAWLDTEMQWRIITHEKEVAANTRMPYEDDVGDGLAALFFTVLLATFSHGFGFGIAGLFVLGSWYRTDKLEDFHPLPSVK
ncbi:hypothetical protein DB346_11205 [Verrucomicrobia bacterium LW23]|nr:hypothetical protein DB346_11205 [Verrucomicrobia bacterium LW23]